MRIFSILSRWSVILTSAFAFFFAISCEPIEDPIKTQTLTPPAHSDPAPSFERGIVGGEETGFQTWKGVIAVSIGHEGICSGTLVAPNLVLTAGHCMRYHEHGYDFDFTFEPESIVIYAGADVSRKSRFVARAERIAVHPDWNGKFKDSHADLALILLDREAEDLPIYPLRRFPAPVIASEGRLVGYGDARDEGGMGIHRAGATTLLKVGATLIETGNPSNACQGDSGGPLLTRQDGRWVVTGVTSFGPVDECSPDSGAYAVNLLGYCDFLSDAFFDLTGKVATGICDRCTVSPARDWGMTCGPGLPQCPGDLYCVAVDGVGNADYGLCASPCCPGAVVEACADIAPGRETCSLVDAEGDSYCAVSCETVADCPAGARCEPSVPNGPSLCVGQNPDEEHTSPAPSKSSGEDAAPATVTSVRKPRDNHRAGSSDEHLNLPALGRGSPGCKAAPAPKRPGFVELLGRLLCP